MHKLESILQWLSYQSESCNNKFKTVSDIEKVYDYCMQSNTVEYVDWESLNALSDEDKESIIRDITELLGYSIF